MKKILLIPLMALIVLLSYADSIPGDVNGDGKVTMADANAIWNHCTGLLKETIDLSAADVNKDGSITKEDAMEAMNIFLTDKEFEEMSGDAMYIKLTTGETAQWVVLWDDTRTRWKSLANCLRTCLPRL